MASAICAFLGIVAITSTGCGDFGVPDLRSPELLPYEAPVPETARFEVLDSAGAEVVHNGRFGALGGELLPVEEILRIGEEEVEPYLFAFLRDIDVTEAGRLVVSEAHGIKLFEADGTFIRRIGRVGQGPGEFDDLRGAFLVGDTVFASDPAQGRMTAFSHDGRILGEWSTVTELGEAVYPLAVGSEGWVVRGPRIYAETYEPEGQVGDSAALPPLPLRRWTPHDEVMGDTVVAIPGWSGWVGEADTRVGGVEGMRRTLERTPFRPRPVWTVTPGGGAVIAEEGAYRLRVYGPDGTLTRIVTRDVDPVLVDEGDLDVLEELHYARALERYDDPNWGDRVQSRRTASAILGRYRHLPLPPHLVPVERLRVGRSGYTWVERWDDLAPAHAVLDRSYGLPVPSRWDIFDAAGRFLGTVELPPGFGVYHVDGLEVVGALQDELDMDRIVRYRVGGVARDS